MPSDRPQAARDAPPRSVTVPLALLALGAAAAALRAAAVVTLPVAAALTAAVLLLPVQTGIARRVPKRVRWLGTAAAMGTFVLALGAIVGAAWWAVALTAGRLPEYRERFEAAWSGVRSWLEARNVPVDRLGEGGGLAERAASWAGGGLMTAGEVAVGIVIVFFLTMLFLMEAGRWREKSRRAWEDRRGLLEETAALIAHKVRQYLVARTLVSAISAVASGLFLWIAGVELALVWALLVFVLNYIPNIGSILSALPPILFAFVQSGWGLGAVVAGGLLAIEQVIGNYVDPRIQGRTLDISPAVVLVAVLFWTFVWGPVGALLAVPATVSILVAAAQVPGARWAAVMLSNDTEIPLADGRRGARAG